MHNMKPSDRIRKRLREEGISFNANDNISEHITEAELLDLEWELEDAVQGVLNALVIDVLNDHNTVDTARRVAKMYLKEVFRGRYEPMPTITEFPNAKGLDELYTLGPITVRSACSHHIVPITGKCWIGIVPDEKVIGISKFVRLAEWVMARPQIQEEATVQLADLIEELIDPLGLAVVIDAQHQCMTWRGVRETNTSMRTSVVRGVIRQDHSLKHEFLELIQ